MKEFSAATEISASAQTIWDILTDAAKYPEWDPGMLRLEGKIGSAEKITIYTKVMPNRAFKVTVSEFVPASKMVWTSGMPLGLFKGERTFTIEPLQGKRTNFSVREVFTGLMLPMIGRSLPDMNPVFAAFAAGLKARAEGH